MQDKADYTISIICALPLERTAVEAMLDGKPHSSLASDSGDHNTYTFGNIGPHHVVIASLESGDYGIVSASGVANDVRRSFKKVRFALLVGIAGAMPRPESENGDVRLGDVVVGCCKGVPSVINYRLGKDTPEGFDIRSELAEPPVDVQRAISALQVQHQTEGPTYLLHLHKMLLDNPRLNRPKIPRDYYNQPETPDELFTTHGGSLVPRSSRYVQDPPETLKDAKFVRSRVEDGETWHDYPVVHYGTIASADTLMKNATERDATHKRVKQQRKADILCFEMEAAGIVKSWPCLVIRGICDYSDEHKNKAWQNFAAATAAAYAKDLLLRIAPETVEKAKRMEDVTAGGECFSISHF